MQEKDILESIWIGIDSKFPFPYNSTGLARAVDSSQVIFELFVISQPLSIVYAV